MIGVDEIGDQRIDDGRERRADDDTDRKVDHIAAGDEFL